MEQENFVAPVTNQKQLKVSVVILLVIIILLVALSGYLFVKYQNLLSDSTEKISHAAFNISGLEKTIVELNTKYTAVYTELNLLKNPPVPPYCNNGTIENIGSAKLCYPTNWKVNSSIGSFLNFDLGSKNQILISTSTLLIEDALKKYTSNVYTDTVDQNKKVDSNAAIEVIGTVDSGAKRAVTVFTIGTTTYQVVLNNNKDVSFLDNLKNYRTLVNSFKSSL